MTWSRRWRDPEERFLEKIQRRSDGCWIWSGFVKPDGYGLFAVDGHTTRAHRWAYENFVGPIPDGLALDHLCRNRSCVNPAHLEPVTLLENVRRGVAVKTHCPHGHPYAGRNLRITTGGYRVCRSCVRERGRKRRESTKATGRTTWSGAQPVASSEGA